LLKILNDSSKGLVPEGRDRERDCVGGEKAKKTLKKGRREEHSISENISLRRGTQKKNEREKKITP